VIGELNSEGMIAEWEGMSINKKGIAQLAYTTQSICRGGDQALKGIFAA